MNDAFNRPTKSEEEEQSLSAAVNENIEPLNQLDQISFAQVRKLDAETEKIQKEAQEVQKRLDEHWLTPKVLVRQTIAGIIAAVLLAVWAIGVLKPMLLHKQEEAEHKNRIAELKHERERLDIEVENKRLKNERESIEKLNQHMTKDLNDLRKKHVDLINFQEGLKKSNQELQKQYDNLAKISEVNEHEKVKYEKVAATAKKEIDFLKAQMSELNTNKAKSVAATADLTEAIQRREVLGEWDLSYKFNIWPDFRGAQISFYSDGYSSWNSWGERSKQQPWSLEDRKITFRSPGGDVVYTGTLKSLTRMSGELVYGDAHGKWSAEKRAESPSR